MQSSALMTVVSANQMGWLVAGMQMTRLSYALRHGAFSGFKIESCLNNASQIEAEARYLHWLFNLGAGKARARGLRGSLGPAPCREIEQGQNRGRLAYWNLISDAASNLR